MSEESKLMSDAKYKQFLVAVDKALKNFEYSNEWADLISCLGKLNKVIQTYSQYCVIPRKLLIGKRLAQCLHPALPSGVHLKGIETYNLIFSQIGSARLAQDLFIYTSGIYPLLGQASMSVKPQLLSLYENHFLPLKRKLYPGLSGFLLALFPGIEEASEFSQRTIDILTSLCESIEIEMFFTCVWDCILHSAQTRLPAMTFILSYISKMQDKLSPALTGHHVDLMVNAVSAAFDDSNVLTQRITLDFALTYVSFETTQLSKTHLVKLLTYALGVLLRRDMSLNRRIFHWFLNTSMTSATEVTNNSAEEEDEEQTEDSFNESSKLLLAAAIIILFQQVAQEPAVASTPRKHLKPFRILITLLDKPEVGSSVLEEVMLEVFRSIYKHSRLVDASVGTPEHQHLVNVQHEIVKSSNLLFNSFEPFFMWDYIGKILKRCGREDSLNDFEVELNKLVPIAQPTHLEMISIMDYLLDIVALESASEVQAEHWPNLLKLIISETILKINELDMSTIYEAICLISKLLSRLAPNLHEALEPAVSDIKNKVSPMASPTKHKSMFTFEKQTLFQECLQLSKPLFSRFVESRVLKRDQKTLLLFQQDSVEEFQIMTGDSLIADSLEMDVVKKTFQRFCNYLVQLTCFPMTPADTDAEKEEGVPEWLQILITCSCHGDKFDIQACAIGTLVDLINVTLTVTEGSSNIVPLIDHSILHWLQQTNLYKILAESLWEGLSPSNCQPHQTCVELFLRLHNITPTPDVCERVIVNQLVSNTLTAQETGYWRFSLMWHISREFYKEQSNRLCKRTIDKCMLLMIEGLESNNTIIRETCEAWLHHCIHFGDIGRVLETLLVILLHPTSARVAIHYAHTWPPNLQQYARSCKGETSDTDATVSGETTDDLNLTNESVDEIEEEYEEMKDIREKSNENAPKSLPTHPMLIHKLLYTDLYDTAQCLYAFRRILVLLEAAGRTVVCAATTTSMSVANTSHQSLLRELLIRHRRVLAGKEFYGSLADAHQLLIRASTAKYIEVLLSVCLYYIRSEYHEKLKVDNENVQGNFLVQAISAKILAKIASLLLEIAKDSGKGFSSYISDLMARCKMQRIGLHCLLSTVYISTAEYQHLNGSDVYSMVDCENLTSTTNKRNSTHRNYLDLQKSLLAFTEAFIHLEYLIGNENIANTKKFVSVSPFEYVPFKPIVSQPMFVSATLTALREKRWMHLHDNWIRLVIACLHKFRNEKSMADLVIPVVNQIAANLQTLTEVYASGSQCSVPVDHTVVLLNGLTSICHYVLIGTSTHAVMVSAAVRPVSKVKTNDDISTSLFSNLVHAFSSNQSKDNETGSNPLHETKEGLLTILPTLITSAVVVWKVWTEQSSTSPKLASKLPLALGNAKQVRLCILQFLTPIFINYTSVCLSSIAEVWSKQRDTTRPLLTPQGVKGGPGKMWLAQTNKKFLPEVTSDQKILLEMLQAIKALSLAKILETSKQVVRQLVKEQTEVHLYQFLKELFVASTDDDLLHVKSSVVALLKESLQLNVSPPSLFVLFEVLSVFVHRVAVPDERRARRDLQELAQKYVDSLNNIAAASLEGSAWFRRSLQVVTIDEESVEQDTTTSSEHPSPVQTPTASHTLKVSTPTNQPKVSQYSVPALLVLAQYFAPVCDLIYASEEKDKVAGSLVYIMYNVIPYLKNHSIQNTPGFRACCALMAAVADYQYTFRAWKKDVYDLFLDSDFFRMDLVSLDFWRTIIDRMITYDHSAFKDLMQKISLSQSGAINIFANREQEMEQRAHLLKRLSFIIFCGEFDQYHQYLPDIQERLAESIRQLQGPFLHEQVFLCFRVLLTRMSPNHLVSLWPPLLTELVLIFVHMEHEVTGGKSKSKSKMAALESFLGVNGYFKDPVKWLRLYLSVCKLLDFLFVLPSDVLSYFQVYKWAFGETPGVYCDDTPDDALPKEGQDKQEHAGKKNSKKEKKKEVSKMAMLNAPISEQQRHAMREKKKKRIDKSLKVTSVFTPFISRIVKILHTQNLSEESWRADCREPGRLILQQAKINSIYELMPFFLGVTGDLAAKDVQVEKLSRFQMSEIEALIERDFLECT